MKKILSLILCCILLSGMAGCAKTPEAPAESGETSAAPKDEPTQAPETESISMETESEAPTTSGEPEETEEEPFTEDLGDVTMTPIQPRN